MVGMGGWSPSLAACSFSAATSKFQADTPCITHNLMSISGLE